MIHRSLTILLLLDCCVKLKSFLFPLLVNPPLSPHAVVLPLATRRKCQRVDKASRVVSASSLFSSDSSSQEQVATNKNAGDEMLLLRFGGIGRLYANNTDDLSVLTVLKRLQQAHVVVVGIGGVGSWACEALVRSAVGHLTLIDLDDICISNTNRQAHTLANTIGRLKTEEMKRRLELINPDCTINVLHDFISVENVREILSSVGKIDVLLDAIDGSKEKSALLATCADLSTPVVTCGGAAGKSEASQIVCEDLVKVEGDKLLGTCRKNLRKRYGFPSGLAFHEKKSGKGKDKVWKIRAVYSKEIQKEVVSSDNVSSLRRCDGALGTAIFVTGSVGFAAAGEAVNMIARDRLLFPRR